MTEQETEHDELPPLPRPDAMAKVRGRYAYAADLWSEGMLWAAVARSPHPSARIMGIDHEAAWAVPGVRNVVAIGDVPGHPYAGTDTADQPVFASGVVRYEGEPVASVAAEDPETAHRVASSLHVLYDPLPAVTDASASLNEPPIHPDGNLIRHLTIRHGDPEATGDILVEGTYHVGAQDQAVLGPQAILAVPTPGGGVEVHLPTQWLHADREQIAQCLAMPSDLVRVVAAGVGGACAISEEIALAVHACLLALRTDRPVKLVTTRAESFRTHAHRHSARLHYRHHVTLDGKLIKVEARILLDGGAYASGSGAVLAAACALAPGPYAVPNANVEGWAVRTNTPPAGLLRGGGSAQVAYGHEAQMDKIAALLEIDPVELRIRNALRTGDQLITGQRVRCSLPVAETLHACDAVPLPEHQPADDPRRLPGGVGNTGEEAYVRRGVGYAAAMVPLLATEGVLDKCTAGVRLDNGMAIVSCAVVETGQGFTSLVQRVVRDILGVHDVVLGQPDTELPMAGPSAPGRRTWVALGAVEQAAREVRRKLVEPVAAEFGMSPELLQVKGDRVVSYDGLVDVPADVLLREGVIEATATYRGPATEPLDENGRGDGFAGFAVAAHRALVEVDTELGLVRVVDVAAAQDAGRVLDPEDFRARVEGGTVQGVGHAVGEEIVVVDGRVKTTGFGDYSIPTAADAPRVVAVSVDVPDETTPLGAKGTGGAPAVSSGPAVVAAIRDATGRALTSVPVRPTHLVGDVRRRPAPR